ncbi:MAG: hypothetical protein A2694_01790 [Candidatus Blackburnbacteria bacterium RIFCSPHIGHO2_01_FULL_40_17]|nr:MAG: hypothetical protein A2694_01790 [Candidatus Blackburnbacteria bacterium RIFCSPHIGHO2_01_FULL_40_17]
MGLVVAAVVISLASLVGGMAYAGGGGPTPTPTTIPTTGQIYTLDTMPAKNVTMWLSSSGTGYGVYALLKLNGQVVTNQGNYVYNWYTSDPRIVTIVPFTGCTNNIVPPCPYDHANLSGNGTGSASVVVVVSQVVNGIETFVAATSFDVAVVETTTPLPTTTTVTPTPTPWTATPSPTPDPSVVYSLEKHPNRDQIWVVQSQPDLSRVWALLRANGQVVENQVGIRYEWTSSDWNSLIVSPIPTCENSNQLQPCPYDHALLLGLRPATVQVGVNVYDSRPTWAGPIMAQGGGERLIASTVYTVNIIVPQAENPPSPPADPMIQLNVGWELVSTSTNGPATASALVSELARQGIVVRQVARWDSGAWSSHLAGFSANDFAIVPGRGYFVKVTTPGVWRR